MNSKQVLDKIMSLLSSDKKEEVLLTYAKLKDGTIVESSTFDVGEKVEIVSEDGKSPAPDGEHELVLRDEEGNENTIKIETKDGVITERENVELETEEVKVEPLAGEDDVIGKDGKKEEMAEELPSGDGVEEDVEPMPGEKDSPFDMAGYGKKLEDMAYRIEEMEKKIEEMGKYKMEEEEKKKEEEKEKMEEDEKELPKLDGAPVDETKLSAVYKSKNKNSEGNFQNKFLSRLYK